MRFHSHANRTHCHMDGVHQASLWERGLVKKIPVSPVLTRSQSVHCVLRGGSKTSQRFGENYGKEEDRAEQRQAKWKVVVLKPQFAIKFAIALFDILETSASGSLSFFLPISPCTSLVNIQWQSQEMTWGRISRRHSLLANSCSRIPHSSDLNRSKMIFTRQVFTDTTFPIWLEV